MVSFVLKSDVVMVTDYEYLITNLTVQGGGLKSPGGFVISAPGLGLGSATGDYTPPRATEANIQACGQFQDPELGRLNAGPSPNASNLSFIHPAWHPLVMY